MNQPMPPEKAASEPDNWGLLQGQLTEQLEHSRGRLREINMMLEQSQLEVGKLAQRNATTSAQMQRLHSQFDNVPRDEIKSVYEAMLDDQKRLLVMRGNLEKLQGDQAHLQKYIGIIEQVEKLIEEGAAPKPRFKNTAAIVESLEMLIKAQESERQRLSRQMHDGPAQALSNLILQTEIAMRLFDIDQKQAREELETLKNVATETFQQVRDFIFELRPMMLDDLGLLPTIKKYTTAFQDQSEIEVSLSTLGTERRLESYLEVLIFRAIQELLSMAAYQSQASEIKVVVDMGEDNMKVRVEDNGRGFELESLEQEAGMGLKVIKERVEMIGGYFEIDSRIGEGTRVHFQIPAALLENV